MNTEQKEQILDGIHEFQQILQEGRLSGAAAAVKRGAKSVFGAAKKGGRTARQPFTSLGGAVTDRLGKATGGVGAMSSRMRGGLKGKASELAGRAQGAMSRHKTAVGVGVAGAAAGAGAGAKIGVHKLKKRRDENAKPLNRFKRKFGM